MLLTSIDIWILLDIFIWLEPVAKILSFAVRDQLDGKSYNMKYMCYQYIEYRMKNEVRSITKRGVISKYSEINFIFHILLRRGSGLVLFPRLPSKTALFVQTIVISIANVVKKIPSAIDTMRDPEYKKGWCTDDRRTCSLVASNYQWDVMCLETSRIAILWHRPLSVLVSTAFHPNAHPHLSFPDTILSSSDAVFYVHSTAILSISSFQLDHTNWRNNLITLGSRGDLNLSSYCMLSTGRPPRHTSTPMLSFLFFKYPFWLRTMHTLSHIQSASFDCISGYERSLISDLNLVLADRRRLLGYGLLGWL